MANIKDLHNLNKVLMLVEYPGVVENEQLAVKTLGGLHNISTTYSLKNRRLELRFRPDDALSKPACGDRHQTISLLMKVKVKRKKNKHISEMEVSSAEDSDASYCSDSGNRNILSYDISVLGCVQTSFRFRNLCDFQFIPMYKDASNTNVCNYDHIVPYGLPDPSWMEKEGPHFLPPATFSRMDTMQHYLYRKEPRDDSSTPPHIIGRTRSRRSGHAMFVTFDVPKVPTKPRNIALKLLRLKFLNGPPLEKMRKMFEERPVWSKSALMYFTNHTRDQLKYLLPTIAYYFVTGPWRVMWVRFGYDPRADPSSRIYQTLDYRIRACGGFKTKVKAKRSYCNYVLPYKSSPSCKPKTSVITNENLHPQQNDKTKDKTINEAMFIFRPGVIPSARQMFYQYCDIKVPEIQLMLDKLPYPPPGTKCHERLGWMPSGIDDRCREIITKLVIETMKNQDADGTSKSKENNIENSEEEDAEESDEDDDDDEEEDYVEMEDSEDDDEEIPEGIFPE